MESYRSGTERAAALDDCRAAAHESVRTAGDAGASGPDEAVFWTAGVATDVQRTWRKHGWIPQDELRAKAKQTVRKAKENSNVG